MDSEENISESTKLHLSSTRCLMMVRLDTLGGKRVAGHTFRRSQSSGPVFETRTRVRMPLCAVTPKNFVHKVHALTLVNTPPLGDPRGQVAFRETHGKKSVQAERKLKSSSRR